MSKNTQIGELINYISVNESGNVVFTTVSAAASNTDKFLVSDAGVLKFRTAAQLLSDIGSQPALSGTGFVKISGTTISYDNATYATQTYVGTAISNLVDSSPATLDTLNELAAALGDDPNFATTVATSIGTKQAQLNGTGFVKISGTTISYDNSTYLTSASLTGYIPYTGATGNVTLGNYELGAKYVIAEGSAGLGGVISIKQDAVYLAKGNGYSSIASSFSAFDFYGYTGASTYKYFSFRFDALTDNTRRDYTLPDSSGTIVLSSAAMSIAGYLPKFETISRLSNSLIYDTGTSLLIGATMATDGQAKLELINPSGPVGLKIKSSGTNGNNTFLSIESSKEWRFLTNRGDLTALNQGDLIIRNNTDGINQIILHQNGTTIFGGTINGTSASFSGNVTLTSGYIEMPWASDTRTIWERYFSSTYFQRISSNGTLRQLRLESNGAYGNASIVLDGQSNTTVTATITSDKFVATGAATFNGNVTTSGVSTLQSAVRINNGTGGTSPILTFGTENESFQGFKGIYLESYWMYMQVHYNEGLRIRATNGTGTTQTIATFSGASGNFSTLGSITAGGTITAGGNISARNFNKYVRSWSSNGSYVWSEQFDAIAGSFDNSGWYKGFIREANGAHYRGFYFDILVGQKGYGGLSSQYRVFNIVSADSPYVGGCGSSAFASIDNNGFTKQANPCGDDLLLYITKLGG